MDALSELIDPSFEIEDRIMPEGAVESRGADALVANAAQVREVFGNIRWTPQEVRELGDRLLLRIRVEGAAQHTGLPIDDDIGHLYTLENGKVIRLVIFRTWEEA